MREMYVWYFRSIPFYKFNGVMSSNSVEHLINEIW